MARQLARAVARMGAIAVLLLIVSADTADRDETIHAAPPYLNVGVLLSPAGQVCTGAVVDSASGNIVVTAAHCLAGFSGHTLFAPGYRAGNAPIGTWLIRSFYTPPAWQQNADPDADYAFLVVEPVRGSGAHGTVQSAAGGDRIGRAPAGGDPVTVIGYPDNRAGLSIECRTIVRSTAEFPTLDCAGFSTGVSGGPLLSHVNSADGTGTIVGVIGGLNTGGCKIDVSYASPFTDATRTVLHDAETGARASSPPATTRASGC